MKIKLLILSCLLSLFCASAVVAQVVDMRAYSRQRGFKAYQPRQTAAPSRAGRKNASRRPEKKTVAAENSAVKEDAESVGKEESAEEKRKDQTAEMQKYIADNPQVRPDI